MAVVPQHLLRFVDGSHVFADAADNGLSLWLLSKPDRPGQAPVYYAGEVVQGKLRLNTLTRITARAVRMKFEARAHVHWTRGSGKNKHTYRQTVQLCAPLNLTLQGAPKGAPVTQPDFALEPGHPYEWAFSFQLPPGPLPGAFRMNDLNNIAFRLCLYLDIPKWPDAELYHDLTVGFSPLPIPPEMTLPLQLQTPQPVPSFCCCFSAGDAVMTLGLPRGSALPFLDGARLDDGQLLPIVAGVDNTRSTRALGPVALTLECDVYRTTALAPTGYGHSDTSRFVVASCELAAGVAAGAAMPPQAVAFPGLVMRYTPQPRLCSYQGGASVVPCPSFNIQILRVSYHLTLTAGNGCGFSPTVTVPVTFFPSVQQPLPPPSLPAPSAPLMEPAAYPSSAPPPPPPYSYNDGQQGKPVVAYAVEDSTGVLGGAPLAEAYRYPVPPAV